MVDSSAKSWKPKYIVISIDGGGIRGLIPALILAEIEKRVVRDHPDHLLSDHVDMFAGTSTGGILSIGMSSRIDTETLVSIYRDEEKNKTVFQPPSSISWLIPDFVENFWRPLYSNEGLRVKLKEILGT